MIDIKLLREQPDLIAKKIATKGVKINVREILKIDENYRQALKKLEELQALKNRVSEQIAKADPKERAELIKEAKTFDRDGEKIGAQVAELETKREVLLYQIPNLPKDDVKVGNDETENKELRAVGSPRVLKFKPLDHLALGERLGLIDVKHAAKTSGSRFAYLTGQAVSLEFALIRYAFDTLEPHGFNPVLPPALITHKSMRAMGYLEHGGDQESYHLSKDDLFLIGTSEHAIGPIHADEILSEADLPLRYVAFSPCFRREAGAYGKDTRGIMRLHQFDKIEMFSFCTPEKSDDEHEFFLALEEQLMKGLEIPYRVIKMCTADLGAPAARKYDIEAWIPSENRYRETHSTSTCTDFQARRLNTRYRSKDQKTEFVHTVNGTVFAIGRTLIAILENYQEADGSIVIPKALQPFMNIDKIPSLAERGKG